MQKLAVLEEVARHPKLGSHDLKVFLVGLNDLSLLWQQVGFKFEPVLR